jgi:hypothetical protein
MRFKKLILGESVISNSDKIESVLNQHKFWWLIDSEVEDAIIEIRNNTIIWHFGNYYSGRWHYGIWKSGDFHGTWVNGIFEKGRFAGKFLSGIIDDHLIQKNKT